MVYVIIYPRIYKLCLNPGSIHKNTTMYSHQLTLQTTLGVISILNLMFILSFFLFKALPYMNAFIKIISIYLVLSFIKMIFLTFLDYILKIHFLDSLVLNFHTILYYMYMSYFFSFSVNVSFECFQFLYYK